jgi:hypothetical protein
MGRSQDVLEEGLMTAADVAAHVLSNCPSLRHFDSYMFGSSLNGFGNDFDLLMVGPSGEALAVLKAELKTAGERLPLDILYMMPEEAAETDFVSRQGCVTLACLAARSQPGHFDA